MDRHNSLLLFFVFGYCFLFSNIILAQQVTISPEVLIRDDSAYSMIGEIDDRIILFRNRIFTKEIAIYDDGLGYLSTVQLDIQELRANVIGITVLEHDFNIYYSYKNEGQELLVVGKYNNKGQSIFRDTIENISTIESVGNYRFQESENGRFVTLFKSLSEKEIRLITHDGREMETANFMDLPIEGLNIRRDFRTIEISDEGSIHILFERFNYKYKIKQHQFRYVFLDSSGNLSQKRIPMADKFAIDVKMVVDNLNKEMKIVGLYGIDYENISQGYFIFSNDDVEYFPFVNSDNEENQGEKIERGLEDYRMMDIVLRQDGGFLFVLELNREYFRAQGQDPIGGYRTGVVDYIAEDIFIVNTNSDGRMAWKSVLPKRQVSQDDNGIFSSYFLFKTSSKLHFVFNDEIKTNNTVSEYVINPLGIFERNAVLSTVYQKLKLRMKSATQISADAFVLISEKGNKLNLVKVQYFN